MIKPVTILGYGLLYSVRPFSGKFYNVESPHLTYKFVDSEIF